VCVRILGCARQVLSLSPALSPSVTGHVGGNLCLVGIYVLSILGSLVSVSIWRYLACRAVGLARIVVGVFWVLEWRRHSGVAIGDCSYTFCYSTVTTIMTFTRTIKGQLFTYISHLVIYI
jgi:hypothetical protein